ncbi:MAG: uracil-DNA glycosylase [Pseudomonadota bacterium]
MASAAPPRAASLSSATFEPAADCALCDRLVEFRRANEAAYPSFHNAPVRSFGPDAARLLIVGLAPGLKGANQTGRPFTGDYAGDLLYETLGAFGFADGTYAADPGDGLTLVDCAITNAVRCVPPQNKPIGAETKACRPFLAERLGGMPNLTAVVALGKLAHDNVLAALSERLAAHKFAHGAEHHVPRPGASDASAPLRLFDSYHCSRYNTNTGRLTAPMFQAVFSAVRDYLGPC